MKFRESKFTQKADTADMTTRFDEVMFELKAIREGMAASTFRSREHSDQLENHESRLMILEASPP